MCKITKKETFDNIEKWIKEIKGQGESDCILMLVGNKCDLESLRQGMMMNFFIFLVPTTDGKTFAEKRNMLLLETSAANNINVEQAFSMLLQEIYKAKKKGPSDAQAAPSQEQIFDVCQLFTFLTCVEFCSPSQNWFQSASSRTSQGCWLRLLKNNN